VPVTYLFGMTADMLQGSLGREDGFGLESSISAFVSVHLHMPLTNSPEN
jgi:hypothetical protein